MKVAVMAYGTRGDVQPLVCLARVLADRGHEVELVADRGTADVARAARLSYRELPFNMQSMFRSERAKRMLARGRINSAIRWLGAEERRYEAALCQGLLEAGTESVDLIVCNHLLDPRCRAIAEARRIAIMPVHLSPLVPSRTFPSTFLAQRSLGPLNRVSHQLPFQMLWRTQRDGLAALRRELGLAPPTRSVWPYGIGGRYPAMLGYSPTLFPAPDDWPDWLHTVGFLRPWPELRASFGEVGVPTELDEWLAAGPPPVFLGFGSMPVLDKEATLGTIRNALRTVGIRGVLAMGWSELIAATDDSLYVVSEVDHESLLPRCAAAVHHGGAGTTAASLGAGLPTLICSVFHDQPFWGARCRKLGIGDTFPFTRLDTRRLVEGLRNVLRPEVAARAKEIARRMAEEDGVAAAVARIEEGNVEVPEQRRSGSLE
ncbi:MAG: glycosyltransferase [Solirubrobacterales bacterium]